MTNAIRHAQSSSIRIALRYEADSLSLTIRDNGRGFHLSDPSIRTGHFGIPVMEERARKLGGALRVTSSIGRGHRSCGNRKLPEHQSASEQTAPYRALDWRLVAELGCGLSCE